MTKPVVINQKRIEKEFPKDVNDRMAVMLNGIVNAEPKAITLLLTDSSPKTSTELGREFLALTNNTWKTSHGNIAGYCRQSLTPIGMVIEEDLQYLGHSRWISLFTSSAAGDYYGKPVAAFALKKTHEYADTVFADVIRDGIAGRSMTEIFGSTNSVSEDSRSPFNTYNILKTLLEYEKISCIHRSMTDGILLRNLLHANHQSKTGGMTYESMRLADIGQISGIPCRQIEPHLIRLRGIGFVDYESVCGEASNWTLYSWIDGKNYEDVPSYKQYTKLTKLVAMHLQNNNEADCHEIQDMLKDSGLERGITDISAILSHIKQAGFATTGFSGHTRSEASITDAGRFFLDDFLRPLESAMQDGNELQNMADALLDYRAYPDRFSHDASNDVAIYLQARAENKCGTMEQKAEKIYELLLSCGERSPVEIADALDMKITSVFGPLRYLINSGKAYKEKQGIASFYTAVDL
ncbi:MAG: helix-turn-helix transcriptional regulator [Candidatus Aenigmarchaeota archaeon]|nr:helix-turn-helix transcriptional regulator [Candidatus Aenigmarchaeota archaeon]